MYTEKNSKNSMIVKRREYAYMSFFPFRVVTSWDNLPNDAVSAPSLNTFKERLDTYWGHHCYSLDPSVLCS